MKKLINILGAALLITSFNHGKTKSDRIQKRNVFFADKNEM